MSSGLRRRLAVTVPNPDCAVIAEATIYIVADSDFVADADAECDFCTISNGHKAEAAIQEIFDAVKQVYLRDACIDLTLSGMDIKTDPADDKYRDYRLSSSSGDLCATGGLLDKFTQWLPQGDNDPSNGQRTILHYFFGLPNASGSRTIGCAWIGTSCWTQYGVGVSEMSYRGTYSSSLVIKRNLLAHELAHNFKADHTSSGIMLANIGSSESFADASVTSMVECVNGVGCYNSCLSYRDGSPTPAPITTSPTKAPTPPPTMPPVTKAPTDVPTKSPTVPPTTKTPTDVPTKAPTDPPTTQAPTKSPTKSPTAAPTTKTPTFSPTTSAPTESCMAYTPRSCDDTAEAVAGCCSTAPVECKIKGKMRTVELCSGVQTAGGPGDPTDPSDATCLPIPESCENVATQVADCCATTTIRCGKGRKATSAEVCVGILA